jgi:hypothetical protein
MSHIIDRMYERLQTKMITKVTLHDAIFPRKVSGNFTFNICGDDDKRIHVIEKETKKWAIYKRVGNKISFRCGDLSIEGL